jgi:hypothetical protein
MSAESYRSTLRNIPEERRYQGLLKQKGIKQGLSMCVCVCIYIFILVAVIYVNLLLGSN